MIVIEKESLHLNATVYAEFTLADYLEFEGAVNELLQMGAQVGLLFDLREMADFTLDVAWEDIVFARAHVNDFSRIAVITESQWVAWSAWLTQIFVSAETRIFSDELEARNWLYAEAGTASA